MFYLLNPSFKCICKSELIWDNKQSQYWCNGCKNFYEDNEVHSSFVLVRSIDED
jgi:hypothetical protein